MRSIYFHRTYTWEHGRQLASMSNGTTTWNYTYNADGMRTSRTNGQKTYTYTYNGDKLTYMTVDGYLHLYFAYDASGVPMSVTYNGTTYYYVTNVQGDVIGILDSSGTQVATYAYDAWGNPLPGTNSQTSEIGTLNPLRYRSYVYDSETDLYYLQSRYYNPEVGRFINADALASTGQGLLGNNMFAYSLNNPVNLHDPNGMCSYSVYYGGAVLDISCYRCRNKRTYIDDQNDETIVDKSLGVVNVGHAGCGPVAAYNAAVTLDLSISFDDVLAYYNSRVGDMYLLGVAGTAPEIMIAFFEEKGYTVLYATSQDSIEAVSSIADACIMYYMFPSTYGKGLFSVDAFGAHFVHYNLTSMGYMMHNTYGGPYESPLMLANRGDNFYALGIFIFENK